MNTSLSWIKMYVPDLDVTAQEYTDAMTLTGTKVEGFEEITVNSRYRNLAADTDDKNHPYQIQQLASHFFHSKNIFKSFKH